MKKNEVLKKGDKVYFYEPYSELIKSGTVDDFMEDEINGKEWVKIHGYRENGDSFIGSAYRVIEECFASREACESAMDAAHEKRQAEYMERVSEVSDLIVFLFSHNMAEDHDACQVAEKKALELFSVDLSAVSVRMDEPVSSPIHVNEAPSFEGVIPVAGA